MGLIPFMKKLIGRIVKTSKCQNPEIFKLWVIVPCHNVSKRFYFPTCQTLFHPHSLIFQAPTLSARYSLHFNVLPFTHRISVVFGTGIKKEKSGWRGGWGCVRRCIGGPVGREDGPKGLTSRARYLCSDQGPLLRRDPPLV